MSFQAARHSGKSRRAARTASHCSSVVFPEPASPRRKILYVLARASSIRRVPVAAWSARPSSGRTNPASPCSVSPLTAREMYAVLSG